MMASAKENKAMPPQPLVAPLSVDPDSKVCWGVCIAKPQTKWGTRSADRGQIVVVGMTAWRRQRCRCGRHDRHGAGNGGVGNGQSLFLCCLLLMRDGKSGWTPLHIIVCSQDLVTMLLLLGHEASTDGNGRGG